MAPMRGRQFFPQAPRAALLCAALLAAACNRDWDAFDPRLGASGPGGASSTSSAGMGGASSTSSVGMGGASSSASTGGAGGAGGAGGGSITVSIPPTVAACINPMALDPAACEAQAGTGLMDVDTEAGDLTAVFHSFIRFDINAPSLAGKTIDGVTLRLVVGPYRLTSASNQTGQLWEVGPFTFDDLSTSAPPKVKVLGDDQGAVKPGQVVTWPLSPALIAAGAVCLGLYPVSSDGVDYWNKNGMEPPELIVDAH